MARPASRLLAALGPDPHDPADADLLARFSARRDAGAFELLVYRHAPLVLRVCRGVLRDAHAAEDAGQAVFLALARQAGSVRGDTLPGWLFRVARRVAARAARRQPPRPADADPDALPAPAATPGPDPAEVHALHEEVDRLPAAYRAPVLLCYFEGLSRAEAARRLGWPVGTVDGRVARAKARLAARLARRGLAPALLAAAAEAVPPGFAGATAEAAAEYAVGRAPAVREGVAGLAAHEIRRTTMTRAAKLAGVVLTLGAVALGLGAATGGDQLAAPAAPSAAAQPPAPAAPAPPKAVFGKGFAVAPVTTDLQRRWLRGGPSLAAFATVNGAGLFPDDKSLALDALDLKGIRSALAGLKPAADQAAFIQTYYITRLPGWPRNGWEVVGYALEGVGRRAGFGKVTASNTSAHREWEEYIAPLRDDAGTTEREAAVGDDKAQAYPVRTPLSRVLADGMAGVVDVKVRVNTAGAALPDGLTDSVRRALRDLRLPRGSRVHVLFNNPPTGLDDGAGDRLRRLAVDWATAEGLEGGTFTTGG